MAITASNYPQICPCISCDDHHLHSVRPLGLGGGTRASIYLLQRAEASGARLQPSPSFILISSSSLLSFSRASSYPLLDARFHSFSGVFLSLSPLRTSCQVTIQGMMQAYFLRLSFAVAVLTYLAQAHTVMTNIYIDGIDQGDGTCVRMSTDFGNASYPIEPVTNEALACGMILDPCGLQPLLIL